jgi:hypothetical protein
MDGEMKKAVSSPIPELMDCHFDPEWGTPYWTERCKELSFDPRTEVRTIEDLKRFGPFPEEDLRKGPSSRFVPKRYHQDLRDRILSETGGTTGPPKRAYFSNEEFQAGFVDPFIKVCRQIGWPEGGSWFYMGPSGPHIIGKVVDPICQALGSPQACRIDFDPRWSLRLAPGSVAAIRYLEHLADQAVRVVQCEEIEVLFGPPAILQRLAERLPDERREKIRAVHYGGTALTWEKYARFREEYYPGAVHLSGYGNSLVGVAFEAGSSEEDMLRYFPSAPRHQIRLIPLSDGDLGERLGVDVPKGERGQVVVTRLDRTCFIPNLVERDSAISIGATPASAALDWEPRGLEDPQPLSGKTEKRKGLY